MSTTKKVRDNMKKQLREEGLSVSEVSRRSGFDRKALTNFLNGHSNDLRMTTVERLAKAMNTTLNELVK